MSLFSVKAVQGLAAAVGLKSSAKNLALKTFAPAAATGFKTRGKKLIYYAQARVWCDDLFQCYQC